MPIYEYECTNCGHIVELLDKITAKPKKKLDDPCPECGEHAPVNKLISGGTGFQFKGSGFYTTDYEKKPSK